jgi:inner membrane protein
LNRKTAYATLAAVLAAEAADIDVLWGLAGPVEGLKHHRGITHTLIAVPVVAAAAVGMVWLFERWREGRRRRRLAAALIEPDASLAPDKREIGGEFPEKHPSGAKARGFFARCMYGLKPVPFTQKPVPFTQKPVPFTQKPVPFNQETATNPAVRFTKSTQQVHWGWLYLTALISALSHLLLDWTNNYGLRPFFPFNPRWYAGSFVFIAEPVLWALLGTALVMPWLLGLADSEIGVKKKKFRGRGWAIFALTGMVMLWGWRWAEQGRARAMAENTQIATAAVKRMALEPYPVNPFRWHAILETEEYYQTAEINTLSGEIDSDAHRDVIYKPAATAATEAAKRTLLGQVYLDWGTWAVVQDVGQEPVPGMEPPKLSRNRTWTTVEFYDLRFDYPFLGVGRTPGRQPLSGWVYIVDGRDEAGEAMNGREQR